MPAKAVAGIDELWRALCRDVKAPLSIELMPSLSDFVPERYLEISTEWDGDFSSLTLELPVL